MTAGGTTSLTTRLARWWRGDGSWRRLEITSLSIVALLGVMALPQPFWANQAIFTLFSQRMLDGDVLYRDIVDLKQPGVFLYYLVAQLPWRGSSVGIHLVELVTWLTFGAVLQRRARSWFSERWLAATLAIPVVGTYYLTATYNDLTQVEALVNIPLLVAVMLALPVEDHPMSATRAFGAGLATAVVALVKLPYAVIPALVLLGTFLWNTRAVGMKRSMRTMVGPAAAGASLIVVPFFVYFGVTGALDEIYELYFEFSRERAELWPRPSDRLVDTTRRTLRIFSPFLVLIALGATLGRRWFFHARSLALLTWAVAAIPLFLVQLWWSYHAFLWLVPLTMLAWFGIDALLQAGPRVDRRLFLGGIGLAVIAFATQLAPDGVDKVTTLASNDFALTEEGRDNLRAEADPTYPGALAWARWNQSLGDEDSAWTLGVPPSFLTLAGQDHHLPLVSWPTQFLRDEDWDRIDAELQSDPPDRLVAIDDVYDTMGIRSPETLAIVTWDYCVAMEFGPYDFLLRADSPDCP